MTDDGILLPISGLPDDVWVCEQHPDRLFPDECGCSEGMLAPGVDEAFAACSYGATREDVDRLAEAVREWRTR